MKEVGVIKGCGIYKNFHLSHLLFIDDALGRGVEKISKWEAFHKNLLKFNNSFGLNINKNKSKLIFDDGGSMEIIGIASIF